MKPFVLVQKNLFQGKIHFSFILVPVDSAELERLNKQNKRKKIIRKIQEAANMAGKMGVKVLSLGAYTSILSNNGLALVEPENTKIVTGNTLTAVSGIHRLIEQIKLNDIFNGNNILGIVGASGNIGSIIAMGLLESNTSFEKVYLIGRNKNKLSKTLNEIERTSINGNKPKIEIATKLSLLKNCNIIIVASNTNDPIIHEHHISKKTPVIISDLSIPAAISKEVTLLSNIINIAFASYIHLPKDPEFKISSHTPRGAVFCCVAEAILYGLEPIDIELKGKITRNGINSIRKLADKYGFFDNMGTVKTYKSNH
jgi:predicted amino acid dehydrogenase